MSSKKISIIPGCITCGACQDIAPELFVVKDIAYVIARPASEDQQERACMAIAACPVQVITQE